jgi:hypothetical protein
MTSDAASAPGVMTTVLALISGLFGGFAGIALWEGLLKPALDAKRLTGGIAAEVSLITRHLDDLLEACIRYPTHVPDLFHFPPAVFAANAGRVGEITVLDDLLLFYAQLAVVEHHVTGWNIFFDRVRQHQV